jgi:hypothetical protein
LEENLRFSVKDEASNNLEGFEDKIRTLGEEKKYQEILEYLL